MGRIGRDWVPCQNYGTINTVNPSATLNIVLVAPRDVSIPTVGGSAPTDVAVVETESEVATTRVVGQVMIVSSVVPPNFITPCAERIRVGLFDNSGATAFFANSFTNAQDANEPFLWQRFQTPSNTGNMDGGFSHPWWSVIDVRVGRRLRQDQALFYSITNRFAAGGPTLSVQLLVRTLARMA